MNRRPLFLALVVSACGQSEAPVAPAQAVVVPPPTVVQVAPAPVAPAAAPTPSPAPAAAAPAGGTALELNSSNPNFGTKSLAPGFVPDPDTTQVVSGGSIDASTLPGMPAGCGGWVTARPDVVLNLSASSSNLRFFVRAAQAGGDTTLIINDGAGGWHCNDDVESGNLNPMIDLANAPAGHYDIWIGSYAQNTQVAGALNITELTSNRP